MRRRLLTAAPVIPVVLLLAGFGALIADGQRDSRRALDERFATRTSIAATFLEAWTDQVLEDEVREALEHLGGEKLTYDDLYRVTDEFDYPAAVILDSLGQLIQVLPPSPGLLGRDLTPQYRHLREAVAGRPAVSDVVLSAAEKQPVVAFAVPYETAYGRRVFSGASLVSDTPLGPFLASMLPIKSSGAYLVDGSGVIISSNLGRPSGRETLKQRDPALAAAGGRTGFYTRAGERHFYAMAPVGGTQWKVFASVPTSTLYEPLSGEAEWVSWLVLAALCASALVAGWLAVRVARHRRRLIETNAQSSAALEEQERLNRALHDFSGHVAHDLRNPLAKINMWSRMLDRPELPESTRSEAVAAIQRSSDEGAQLVTDLLELAVASGTPKREPLAFGDLSAEAATGVDGIALNIENSATISADRVALRQAIRNLLANASAHGRRDGVAEVTLRCVEVSEGWKLEVEDRGPGIAPGQAEKLFAPFTRGEASSGTGLGLAIVRATAEAHGGRVWHEPGDQGGSRFCLLICKPGSKPGPDGSQPEFGATVTSRG
ncbi:MAG TPA: sensor histidine kinase [Actinomycetota bacterium]|nr:sensor histidine kinase [Actinomycetota bacterium]